jgi:tol-pal system protein YbgF
MRYRALVLFVLFGALGCASTQEVGQIRGDVTSVYGEFTGYKEKTDARLEKLEKRLSTSEEALRKQMADLSVALESREDTMKKILGRIEELESQLRAYWDETKGRLRDLKRPSSADSNMDEGKAPTATDKPARVSEEAAYKEAFETFRKGRHEEALRRFTEFLKHYPDSPLVPSAHFWMGESAMSLKDYENAIVYFQEVVDKHPKSDKASKALLRQADAFAATGDKKTSMILLKRIIEVYPKSEEARVAERSLRGGSR